MRVGEIRPVFSAKIKQILAERPREIRVEVHTHQSLGHSQESGL
jgi:hypothetical protein